MVMPADAAAILLAMYPGADPVEDFQVADSGAGPVIAKWNAAKLGAQPSEAAIIAAKPAADAATAAERQRRQQVIAICKAYDPDTATAAQVRTTLGASLYLLRQFIKEIKP